MMHLKNEKIALILLFIGIFLLNLNIVYSEEFQWEREDIYLVRPNSSYIDWGYIPPEYISEDDLIFYTCLEEENLSLRSSLICLDDNSFEDVETERWFKKNCHIASYDLSQWECSDMIIQSEYIVDDENVRLSKKIKINRLSSVIDYVEDGQYSDGGWTDALSTAHGIFVLSHFNEIYGNELDLAMGWLKLYRNNTGKCWPEDECDATETANIMALLTLSGYNDSTRIVHDGNMWLQKYQNYGADGRNWKVNMAPYENDIECVFSYGNSTSLINISANTTAVMNVTSATDYNLDVVCTDNIVVNVTTADGQDVIYYEGDNLSYPTPGACWSDEARWSSCDVKTSIFSLISGIPEENKDVAKEWLVDQVIADGNKGGYVGSSTDYEDSALYLYIFLNQSDEDANITTNNTQDVIDWIRYKQNNEGSWGNKNITEDAVSTGYVVLSLLSIGFLRTNEVIEDAETWFSDNEPDLDTNSTISASWVFYVLKNNNRPLLKADPMILIVNEEETEIKITNPTTFDLREVTYGFSPELAPVLDIDTEDTISAYSYVKLKIYQKEMEIKNTYGYLIINNSDIELAKIPIMIVKFPKINISTKDELIMFGTKGSVVFDIAKTAGSFECSLSWTESDISSKSSFTISSDSTLSVDLLFDEAARVEKTYSGAFDCESDGSEFEIPFSVHVNRYPQMPLSVEPTLIRINETGKDAEFTVINRLDETIDVAISFEQMEDFFEFDTSKIILNPGERKNITIFNLAPAILNISSKNTINVIALEQKETLSFRVDIQAIEVKSRNPAVFWSIIALTAALLIGGGFFGFRYRKNIVGLFSKKAKVEEVKNKIRQMEEKGTNMAIVNMARLLRFQGKTDEDLKKKLFEEGFNEDEINTAMSTLGGNSEETEEEV